MTTPKLCSDCIHYHVPASKEPCRDCLPQTVAVPNFTRKPEFIEWSPVLDYKVVPKLFLDGELVKKDHEFRQLLCPLIGYRMHA